MRNRARPAAAAEARSALRGALDTLAAKRAILESYEQGVRQRLPGLRDMAETAYKSGATNLLELLDSVRVHIDVTLEGVNLRRDVTAAQLDVLAAAGLLGDRR